MTELPVMNPEPKSWWLAVHESRGTCVLHRRSATLEDVRQVLDAAGYVVVEKKEKAYNTPPPIPEGIWNEGWSVKKTSGAPAAALVDSEEGGVAPRPAGGREEPGTIVPEFGQDRRVLLVSTLGKTGIRRATFADLHELEKEHWISLRPCSECEYGPVNDKICTTCFELVEAKLAELQVRHTNLLMKLGEKLSEMSAADLIKMVSDGATVGAAKLHEQVRDLAAKVVALDHIAKDAIAGMRLVGHGCAADVLQERLDALK